MLAYCKHAVSTSQEVNHCLIGKMALYEASRSSDPLQHITTIHPKTGVAD